jgi:hypothetical protein
MVARTVGSIDGLTGVTEGVPQTGANAVVSPKTRTQSRTGRFGTSVRAEGGRWGRLSEAARLHGPKRHLVNGRQAASSTTCLVVLSSRIGVSKY